MRRETFDQSIKQTNYDGNRKKDGPQYTMDRQNKANMVAGYNIAMTQIIGRKKAEAVVPIVTGEKSIPDSSKEYKKSDQYGLCNYCIKNICSSHIKLP